MPRSRASSPVVLTASAGRSLAGTTERWRSFLAVALVTLAEHSAPDGLTRLVAPADSGHSGLFLYLVPPFRIVYQVNTDAVNVIAIHRLSAK